MSDTNMSGHRATGRRGRCFSARRAVVRCLAAIALCASLAPQLGHAQGAQERQAAAEAFDRGTSAYLGDDFAGAARWFEMANNLAPAAPALLQAIRSHQRAGNELRAGTLALRLVARFPDAGAAVNEAQSVLEAVRQRYFLVEVVCPTECAVELNGTLQSHPAFFLQPDERHTVGAGFPTGNVTEEVHGAAGEQRTVSFDAPEGQAVTQDPEGTPGRSWVDQGRETPRPETTTRERSGVHPAAFVTSLVLTVGAGAMLVWSGLDTLSARDEYVDVADQERRDGQLTFPRANALLDDGQGKELRTNVLIGATAGLAAITLVFAIVTDWGGGSDDDEAATSRVRPTLGVSPNGAAFGLGGSF